MHQFPDARDRLADRVGERMPATEPDRAVLLRHRAENAVGHDEDAFPQQAAVKLHAGDRPRQSHPEEHPSLRLAGHRPGREMIRDGAPHFRHLLLKMAPEAPQMPVHALRCQKPRDHQLIDGRGVEARDPFQPPDPFRIAPRRDPADPQAGTQHFGNRATVDHPSATIEGFHGAGPFRGEMQIAVEIVLDQRDPGPLHDRHQLRPPLFAQAGPRRVVEARDQRHRLHGMPLEGLV